MITVRAFKAPDDPEACLRFYNGHLRLLEIYFGIAKITSGSADWMHHENSIVIIVRHVPKHTAVPVYNWQMAYCHCP